MKLLKFFKRKRDAQKFPSKKLQKVINNAIQFLDKSPTHHLPLKKFNGCGVYMLYYDGCFYDDLTSQNNEAYFITTPIYVGKAVPTGWRNGRTSKSKKSVNLWKRIQEHTSNIQQATNLDIKDFCCRYVVLDDDLIVPVEAKLIRNYKPLWNCHVSGFGNHHPGATRFSQARSDWDILHPGRVWSKEMKDGNDWLSVVAGVRKFMRNV